MSSVRVAESAGVLELSNGHVSIEVELDAGTFSIADIQSGRTMVANAASSAVLADGSSLSSRSAGFVSEGTEQVKDRHGEGVTLRLRSRETPGGGLSLDLTLYDDHPFAVLRSRITNTSADALHVQAFHVLDGARLELGGMPQEWRFYKEGWQNWSPALVLPCSGEDIYMAPPVVGPATQPAAQAGRFLSEMVTAIASPHGGQAITAGFVSTADQFSQVWLEREAQSLTAASYADGIELVPGASLASERLLIDLTPDPLASLQRYGDALAREMGATPWAHAVSGWCSWYYYWQGVREEEILANLEYLRWHRRELPVEYVQIDDGYQAGIGDWLTANEKFPRGMGWLAGQIHDRGYKAGLWLAPFMIGAKSRLWQEHPDWAVQYPSAGLRTGKPGRPYIAMINWGQECYAMDLTRPDVIEWLGNVFGTVFRDWGYDYVKIDFLYAGAVDGIRRDPNVTRAQAYRRGVEAIRRAAGDKFILGCGNPVAPSVGLVNGMRIGPDVAPFWYPAERPREPDRSDLSTVSTLNGIRNILSRFWMHERLWLNDPDCMLARDSETALTAEEVRTLATVIAMSGGMALDSDNLMRLSDERREIVSMLLPPYRKSAVPLDLFESEMPRLLELDCGAHKLLAVFNWADEPAEVRASLPGAETHVFEVWEREYLGIRQGSLLGDLPAHGCRLLALRPALGRPQLVGSSFHLLQGAVEVTAEEWDGETLRLSLRPVAKREGELFVWAPDGWGQPSVSGPEGIEVTEKPGGLWSVRLEVEGETEVRLKFDAR